MIPKPVLFCFLEQTDQYVCFSGGNHTNQSE